MCRTRRGVKQIMVAAHRPDKALLLQNNFRFRKETAQRIREVCTRNRADPLPDLVPLVTPPPRPIPPQAKKQLVCANPTREGRKACGEES
ncbi:hypothetical protein SAMN05216386_1422 [Nitrosospira briensis]|uniref:Uncharacterized protein n=1 Tax=Nitrosospira briensis TaxID=35799 RepID=A0A1I5AJS6_9PROT|nr:hypothetical protein SAMN05216386_1422 [Nitrosospira briensis]